MNRLVSLRDRFKPAKGAANKEAICNEVFAQEIAFGKLDSDE